MFDYTIAAYKKTVKDCKTLLYWTTFLLQVVYLSYLGYAIATSKDAIQIVNIVLCGLSLAYFIFFAVVTRLGKDKDAQKKSKPVKEVLAWCKRLIRVYTLGVMIFGIFQTVRTVTPLAVVLAVLMVVIFVLEIVFAVLSYIVEKRLSVFISAIMHDIRPVTEAVRKSGNFFKKLKGEETEPEPIISELDERNLEFLTPLVDKEMEERREKEEEKRQQKKRQKQEEKEQRKAEKLAKRAAKKQKSLPPAVGED